MAPDPLAAILARAAAVLAGHPDGISSTTLASLLLRTAPAGEAASAAILRGVLGRDGRFQDLREKGWRLREGAAAVARTDGFPAYGEAWGPGSSVDRVAWAVWAIAPDLKAAAVVRLEGGRRIAERSELARKGSLGASALGRLARLSRSALWSGFETASRVHALRSRIAAIPRMRDPGGPTGRWVPLAGLARAVLGPPGPVSLERLAARLRLPITALEDPAHRAQLAADCLCALLERPAAAARCALAVGAVGAGSAEVDAGALIALAHSRLPLVIPDGARFGETELRAVPAEPGVYRFYSDDGGLLYVGKSANLRRRLRSYFVPRAAPDPRTASWLDRVRAFRIEPASSDLDADLREARGIALGSPEGNRQRSVHERPGRSLSDMVVILAAPSGARAFLIQEGRLAARVRLGRRTGGWSALAFRLEELYFGGGGESRPKRQRPAVSHREGRLIASWLGRQELPPSGFDPSEVASAAEALALARLYAESAWRGERGVVHRPLIQRARSKQ